MTQSVETEDQLIQRAQAALSRCNWEIGECAAQWTQKYARGRTDADFAALIGLSGDQVYQRRRVWETFSDVMDQYASLKWSHFYAAINWPDASECLQWALDMGATVAEMKAWRRAQHGEDLSQPPAEEPPFAADTSYLPVSSGFVQDFDGDEERPGSSRPDRDGGGFSGEREPVAAAAARETDSSGYAPFGKNARGSAPGEESTTTSAAAPPLHVLKRVMTALERVDAALTPGVLEAFAEAPSTVQQRMLTAMDNLQSKFAGMQ